MRRHDMTSNRRSYNVVLRLCACLVYIIDEIKIEILLSPKRKDIYLLLFYKYSSVLLTKCDCLFFTAISFFHNDKTFKSLTFTFLLVLKKVSQNIFISTMFACLLK